MIELYRLLKNVLYYCVHMWRVLANPVTYSNIAPTIRHKLNCLHTLRKKAKKSPTTHNLNQLAIAEQDFKDYVDRSKASQLFTALLIIQITKSTNTSGIFLRVKVSPLQCFMMMLVLPVTKLGQIFSMNIFTLYLPHPRVHYLRFGNSHLIPTHYIQST